MNLPFDGGAGGDWCVADYDNPPCPHARMGTQGCKPGSPRAPFPEGRFPPTPHPHPLTPNRPNTRRHSQFALGWKGAGGGVQIMATSAEPDEEITALVYGDTSYMFVHGAICFDV